jgi:hypothetical protein
LLKASKKAPYFTPHSKKKYEAFTWSRRVTLRDAFHRVKHDISKPVEQYVQEVSDLKDQLTALGEEISNNYFKDVLLANLDPLYIGLRNTLLGQPGGESELNDIKSVISGATYIKPDGDIVKSEPEDTALATRAGGGRKVFASSGSAHAGHGNSGHRVSGHAAHSSGDDGHSLGMEDKNGYRWCDPTNENHCHRCGRRNHIAARCVADMPKEIKTWILDRPGAHERSNADKP